MPTTGCPTFRGGYAIPTDRWRSVAGENRGAIARRPTTTSTTTIRHSCAPEATDAATGDEIRRIRGDLARADRSGRSRGDAIASISCCSPSASGVRVGVVVVLSSTLISSHAHAHFANYFRTPPRSLPHTLARLRATRLRSLLARRS